MIRVLPSFTFFFSDDKGTESVSWKSLLESRASGTSVFGVIRTGVFGVSGGGGGETESLVTQAGLKLTT